MECNCEKRNVKPILTVAVPFNHADKIDSIHEALAETIKDYHIIVYIDTGDNLKFHVFYDKDADEKKVEDVTQFVKEEFEKLKLKLK